MRILSFLFLALFIAAVAAIAYYNQEPATLRVAQWSFTSSLAVVVGAAYVLGMISGWALLRMIRRSASSVADSLQHRHAARA